MRIQPIFATLGLLLLALAPLPASVPYMPVDEVKPGMTGVGRTVFEGTRIDEFQVTVLGVLRNLTGPKRTVVLARLAGGPLASAGVIAGMSGSPVYIDGRLVGAVAYSLGSFSKEPIAGITPIGEMLADADRTTSRARTPGLGDRLPVTRDEVLAFVRGALPRLQPFAASPDDVQLVAAAASDGLGPGVGARLRPIDTPLAFSGFSDEVRGEIEGMFAPGGFVAVPGSDGLAREGRQSTAHRAPLRPGDAVGVDLITGDLSLGATGTVTEVVAGRVYAFGHQLYNLGPTAFPMTRAYVHAVLPSLLSSMKVTTTGEAVGTVRQDRASGIAGTLDDGPPMIPLSIVVTADGSAPRTFKLGLARDQVLTPLLAYTALSNILLSYERSLGAATVAIKGSATIRDHGAVLYDDVYAGDSAAITASSTVAAPLVALMGNEFERADVEAIALQVGVSERQRSATIQRAWIDTDRPRPGKTVMLKVVLRGYRGDEDARSIPVEIPARASGTLTLLVADAAHAAEWEQREMRVPQPWSLDQLVRTFNRAYRASRLYVRLASGAAGALVGGEQLPALPPSVLAVYEGDRYGGSFAPLRNALLGEWEIATDVAVIGSRQLTFTVDPDR